MTIIDPRYQIKKFNIADEAADIPEDLTLIQGLAAMTVHCHFHYLVQLEGVLNRLYSLDPIEMTEEIKRIQHSVVEQRKRLGLEDEYVQMDKTTVAEIALEETTTTEETSKNNDSLPAGVNG